MEAPAKYTKEAPVLYADGAIWIYDVNTSEIVAQYQGLGVHQRILQADRLIEDLIAAIDPLLYVFGDGIPPDDSFKSSDEMASVHTAEEIRAAFEVLDSYHKYQLDKR